MSNFNISILAVSISTERLTLETSSENPKVEEIDDPNTFFKHIHRRYDTPALKRMLTKKIFTGSARLKVERHLVNTKSLNDSSDSSEHDASEWDNSDTSDSDQ